LNPGEKAFGFGHPRKRLKKLQECKFLILIDRAKFHIISPTVFNPLFNPRFQFAENDIHESALDIPSPENPRKYIAKSFLYRFSFGTCLVFPY